VGRRGARLFAHRLAGFARVLMFDKRGTGLSDAVAGLADLETRMDDVRAVMDAAGSRRAAIVGMSEGAPMTVLFAATYPERTAAIVIWGGPVTGQPTPDTPWVRPREERLAAAAESSARGERSTLAPSPSTASPRAAAVTPRKRAAGRVGRATARAPAPQPRSMARRARSGAPARSRIPCASSASRCAPDCIPASAS
jgi:pimeloyl-ACP methyl ester carboxylesterase